MGLEYPHDREGWNSEPFRTHIHIFKSKVKVDFKVERSKKKNWNLTRNE